MPPQKTDAAMLAALRIAGIGYGLVVAAEKAADDVVGSAPLVATAAAGQRLPHSRQSPRLAMPIVASHIVGAIVGSVADC